MDVRLREWSQLEYLDAERILRGLLDISSRLPLHDLPYQVSSLRDRQLRSFHEGRQGALFCYGVSKALGLAVEFAQLESSDYDIVARYERADELHYVPIQLKELVPEHVNGSATLQRELNKIEKYADASDLVVAFHLNRAERIDFKALTVPRGIIKELWFYGACSADRRQWLLVGNALSDRSQRYDFHYPGA